MLLSLHSVQGNRAGGICLEAGPGLLITPEGEGASLGRGGSGFPGRAGRALVQRN